MLDEVNVLIGSDGELIGCRALKSPETMVLLTCALIEKEIPGEEFFHQVNKSGIISK